MMILVGLIIFMAIGLCGFIALGVWDEKHWDSFEPEKEKVEARVMFPRKRK